ncbi:apolipoprotein B-100-like [Salvelinus alpinus]
MAQKSSARSKSMCTTERSLSEVIDVDTEGSPVFTPAAGAEAFQAFQAKPPFAECDTDFAVNSREDIATDVTVTRHLSKCDSFIAQKDHTSPMSIISGMQYPLSKLISSTQTCNYKFDNQKKHMTAGSRTEKHIFLPFSHQSEYGVSTLVKQTLTLLETSKINERVFNHNEVNLKGLPMEAAEDKAVVQTGNAALATMRELNTHVQDQPGPPACQHLPETRGRTPWTEG